jgi:hypothetical protein
MNPQKVYWSVIPAKAGMMKNQIVLDSCFRRSDDVGTFCGAAGIARCFISAGITMLNL